MSQKIKVELTNNFHDKSLTSRISWKDEVPPVITATSDTSSSNPTNETIESFLNRETWLAPYEYYSSVKKSTYVTKNTDQGFYYVKNDAAFNDEEMSYFWLDELKTWCKFIYFHADDSTNNIVLTIWNGKDNWIAVPNLIVGETTVEDNQMFVDKYKISSMQQPFFNKLIQNNDVINMAKGWCQTPSVDTNYNWSPWISGPEGNTSTLFYFHQQGFLRLIKAIRLQKTTKYTINKADTFITNRWSSIPYYYTKIWDNLTATYSNYGYTSSIFSPGTDDALARYAQTNFTSPITTGLPCVWRLPTGEIALCTTFIFRSDNGAPYHYEVHYSDGQESWKFRKQYDKATDGYSYIYGNRLLGENTINASRWLNETCANFFGNGKDKTIANDWLREYIITEENNSSVNNYENMLDSTLTFEQQNINKVNSLSCSFTVNRPVVTTETIDDVDYIKKW